MDHTNNNNNILSILNMEVQTNMKWETYNKLTKEQKEEYNYKFEKTEESPIDVKYLIVFYLAMGFYIMMSWILIKVPVPNVEYDPMQIMTFGMRIGLFIGWLVIIQVIVWLTKVIIQYNKEKKWLKERGIIK